MKQEEEYEGQIEDLKKKIEQYQELVKVLDIHSVELPYRCTSCNSWMEIIEYEDFHYYDTFDDSTNTWHSQNCLCCPVCAKEDYFENEKEHIETQKKILDAGGQPCTECMEWYTNIMSQKIENAIIKFSGMEGYTDDVYHALQYVSDEDLYSHPRYPNPWGPNRETPKSWCDNNEWFEIAFA